MGTPSHGVNIEFVTSIVLQKTPDGFMLQFGSLTAWNTGLELDTTVVWQKFQCRVMGTTTEDRDSFAIVCKEIGDSFWESIACASIAVCIDADDKQEYPVTIFVTSIVAKKSIHRCSSVV